MARREVEVAAAELLMLRLGVGSAVKVKAAAEEYRGLLWWVRSGPEYATVTGGESFVGLREIASSLVRSR